jgi:K+ transporter
MSPRGLISILLFLQIKEVSFIDSSNSQINEQVLLVVILASMLIMTLGTMKKTKQEKEDIFEENIEESNNNSLDTFLEELADDKDKLT